MITATIILIVSTLVSAEFSILTNRPEAIDMAWAYQKYHEIANNSKEFSADGTGLKLAGIFYDDDMPTFRARMGYGNYTPRISEPNGFSRIIRAAKPVKFNSETCLAEPNGDYGFAYFFTPSQQHFITNQCCDLVAAVQPDVWAVVGVFVTNAVCNFKGKKNTACKLVAAVGGARAGVYLGTSAQNYCTYYQGRETADCGNAGFIAKVTMTASNDQFNVEALAAVGEPVSCLEEPGEGDNARKCVQVKCKTPGCTNG